MQPSLQAVAQAFGVMVLTALTLPAIPAADIDFERDIRPLLARSCTGCHAGEQAKSGLRLDIRSEAFRGGNGHGAAIVPGRSDASPLVQFVRGDDDLRMPPPDAGFPPLSVAETLLLAAWVDAGAKWPEGIDSAHLIDRRNHWSFLPVTHPAPPPVRDTAWPKSDIDRFILARLEDAAIAPSPEADRPIWLRRVSLDLTGLPPSPEEVQRFVADQDDQAYERVVDALLASPRYGERMAEHWLDVVRYADTHGYEVNTERPNAWPYRDWCIAAFNDDLPYDRFVRSQIAGDADGNDAATGFLVTAAVLLPGQIGADDVSKRLARQDALNDILINTGEAFLGLSVGCARCHDHKFDPLSQRDYHSLQAVFSGVLYEDRAIESAAVLARQAEIAALQGRIAALAAERTARAPLVGTGARRPAVSGLLNVDRIEPRMATGVRFTILATNTLEPCIDEFEVFDTNGRNVASAAAGATVTSSGNRVDPGRHELPFLNDGQYGNERSWMSDMVGGGWVEIAFAAPALVDRIVWGRDRKGIYSDRLATGYRIELAGSEGGDDPWQQVADESDRIPFGSPADAGTPATADGVSDADRDALATIDRETARLRGLIATLEVGMTVFGGRFTTPDPARILHRGDPEQPQEEVGPRSPVAFDDRLLAIDLPIDEPEQARRLALARWLVDPSHPLTHRVIVNRIWQWHFGTGLVETASDLGRSGTLPSHPELLDWLAGELVDKRWSLKALHRQIVLSATYRQAHHIRPEGLAVDAGSRLLWRFPSRRLEAEAIRDSMLFVSGRLDLTMGGRGFDLFKSRGGLNGFPPIETFSGDGLKRMIYAHKVRMEKESVFGAFDCPDAGLSTPRRRQSMTPIQALNLFNSPFTIAESEAFAARVAQETFAGDGDPTPRQVERAVWLALGRSPSAEEFSDAVGLVRDHGLPALCRVLYNTSEFVSMP